MRMLIINFFHTLFLFWNQLSQKKREVCIKHRIFFLQSVNWEFIDNFFSASLFSSPSILTLLLALFLLLPFRWGQKKEATVQTWALSLAGLASKHMQICPLFLWRLLLIFKLGVTSWWRLAFPLGELDFSKNDFYSVVEQFQKDF